jgi:hypothetical protein
MIDNQRMPRQSTTKKAIAPVTIVPRQSSTPVPPPMPMPVPTSVSTPTFGQTLKEGFAFGTGSAIAHRVVGAIFGPLTAAPSAAPAAAPRVSEKTPYEQCLAEHYDSDPLGFCAHLLKRETLNQ